MLVRTFSRLLCCLTSCVARSTLLASIIDAISFLALYPSAFILDQISRRFLIFHRPKAQNSIETEKKGNFLAWMKCLILAPFICFCILGVFLRITKHIMFPRQRYYYIQSRKDEHHPSFARVLSIASCDILPIQQALKLDDTVKLGVRHALTVQRLVKQHPYFCETLHLKDMSNASCFPRVDFLCMRNVWGQHLASRLVKSLASRFSYFIVDKGDCKLRSNFCLLGSGLFLASNFPLITFQFTQFQRQKWYSDILYCGGVICTKVEIPGKGIGLISNYCTPSLSAGSSRSYNNLTEVLSAINAFRQKNIQKGEEILIDVLCGDFDLNDESYEHHPVFNQYTEISANELLDGSEYQSRGIRNVQFAGEPVNPMQSCASVGSETILQVQLADITSVKCPEDELPLSKRKSFVKNMNSRVLLRKGLPLKVISFET